MARGHALFKRWSKARSLLDPHAVVTVDVFARHLMYGRQTIYNYIADELIPPLDGRYEHKPGKPGYWNKDTLEQGYEDLKRELLQ